jgi:O-antigen/teichoic acid export membrane protein
MIGNTATTSRRLILNTICNLTKHIVVAAVGFFMIPFFVRTLGEEQYGIWILVGSVFAYRNTLNMGLNSAVNRYIPMFLAKNEVKRIQAVISTSMLYLCFTSIILIVTTLVVHRYIEVWFCISPNFIEVAKALVLVVGFCFVAMMPLQVHSGVLSGLQRYDIVSALTIIPVIIRTVVLILLLSKGYGLLTMGLAFGICEIAIRVSQALFVLRLLPHISISAKSIDFSLLWQMLHYGANTLLYVFGAGMVRKSSDIIIGIFLNTKDITGYYIASSGILGLGMLIQAFAAAIKPAVSDLDARDNESKIRQIAFLTQKYILILLMPSVFFLLVMGKDFLRVWVGANFGELHVILILLSVGHFLRLAQYSNFLVLVGKGEHQIFGILAGVMVICTIPLAIVFVKRFNFGLMGIALSNLLPMSLICGLILPIYFNSKMNISFKDCACQIWWPALAGCSPALFFIGLWKYYHCPNCWLHIATVVTCAFVITIAGAWLWSLSPVEKRMFLRVFSPRQRV